MKLHIKNMVSNRCKMLVKEELEKFGLNFIISDLGEVEIKEDLSADQRAVLKMNLILSGLELMDDKRTILIEKIKNVIIEMVYNTDEIIKTNFSVFISEKLHYDYTYLANLFSEVQGTTIEQFIIHHKVERIKELIICGELSIKEIAWKLKYSSVAHLSNQFKQKTGLSPSHFKQLKEKRQNPVEDVRNSNSAYKDELTFNIFYGESNIETSDESYSSIYSKPSPSFVSTQTTFHYKTMLSKYPANFL